MTGDNAERVTEATVGEYTVDVPAEGSTVEDPPNGGFRAWLVVSLSAAINFMLAIIVLLIGFGLLITTGSEEDIDLDEDERTEIFEHFTNLSNAYSIFAALFMVRYGYRKTVVFGALVFACTLLVLANVRKEAKDFIKLCFYCPAAMGSSFILLGSLIPVLEYFSTKRRRALLIVRVCTYMAQLLAAGLFFADKIRDSFYWRTAFLGAMALCVGIGILGMFLKDLKLTMNESPSRNTKISFVQRALGVHVLALFKNGLFYGLISLFFFFQLGANPLDSVFQDNDFQEHIGATSSIGTTIAYALVPFIGLILGSLLAWILNKVAAYPSEEFPLFRMIAILVGGASFVLGVASFIATNATFGYGFTFRLLYAICIAYIDMLRDDSIPKMFGPTNTRVVEGFVLLVVGVAGIIATEITGDIDEWQYDFVFCGAMLLLTAIGTGVILVLVLFVFDKGNRVRPLAASGNSRCFPQSSPNHAG
ncbi:uncharacterized protein LOC128209196 [Mya arenaria]|uniref:uncharacterized protein LOC128209196 n=1 Tax=Mya arenaria TaxID=6604 RepID=UPI0022E02824|nr:uncharacterized protein LOC128209196 [Mya arenaria]